MSRQRHTYPAWALIPLVAASLTSLAAVNIPASSSLAEHAAVLASSACPEHPAANAVDNDPATRWCAQVNTRSGWIEVDLGKPTSITRALVVEGPNQAIARFQLQALVNNQWEPIAFGGFIGDGAGRLLTFDPVTTQRVRLTICEAKAAPSIAELRLFND